MAMLRYVVCTHLDRKNVRTMTFLHEYALSGWMSWVLREIVYNKDFGALNK